MTYRMTSSMSMASRFTAECSPVRITAQMDAAMILAVSICVVVLRLILGAL